MKSYKDLEIYTQAFDLAVRIYFLAIKLPHPDKFETGCQIRRSSQSSSITSKPTGKPDINYNNDNYYNIDNIDNIDNNYNNYNTIS